MKIEIHTSLKKKLSSSKAISCHFGNKDKDIIDALTSIKKLNNANGLYHLKRDFCEFTNGAKGVYRLVIKGGLRMIMRIIDSHTVKIIDLVDYHYFSYKFIIKYNNIY